MRCSDSSSMTFTRRRLAYAFVLTSTGFWLFFFYRVNSFDPSLTLLCAPDLNKSMLSLAASSAPFDSSYLPFKYSHHAHLTRSLLPATTVPVSCLDGFISQGLPCIDYDPPKRTFDVVWTWVNGSDALHQKSYLEYSLIYNPPSLKPDAQMPSQPRRFRFGAFEYYI